MKKYSFFLTCVFIAILIFISLLFIVLADKFILTPAFYDQNGQPMSGIPEMELTVYRQVSGVVFWYAALYLIVKLLVVSGVLFTGLYAFGNRAPFLGVLMIVTLAEFLFLVPAAVKVWWFARLGPGFTLDEWQQFYFLSAASLSDRVRPVYLYPLQTFNVFELGYWFLLAAGLRSLTGLDFDRSLRVVVFSYVPALFLWIAVVVFFAMIYFPEAY